MASAKIVLTPVSSPSSVAQPAIVPVDSAKAKLPTRAFKTDDRFRNYFSSFKDSENFKALKAGILRSGVLKACVVWENAEGKGEDILIDGYHRLLAVDELRAEGHDIKEPEIKKEKFGSVAEAKLFLIAHQSAERPLSIADRVKLLEGDAELTADLQDKARKNQKRGKPLSDVRQRGGIKGVKAAIAGISRDTYNEYARVMQNPKAHEAVQNGITTYHKAFKSIVGVKKKLKEEYDTLRAKQFLPDWTDKTTGINTIAQCDVLIKFPLPDNSVDLWFYSSPYPIDNNKVPYIVPFFEGTYEGDGERTYLTKLRKVIRECYRTLKPDRYMVINIDNCGPTQADRDRGIRQYNCFKDVCLISESEGFIYSDVHHWYKQKAVSNRPLMGTRENPRGQRNVEFIIVFYKPGTKDTPPRAKNNDLLMADFHKLTMAHWDITPNQAERNKWKHPAPFPFALAERVAVLYSRRNEVVGDCFNGVGTTTAAAVANGRQYVGLEINAKFCMRAKARLKEAQTLAKDRVKIAKTTKAKTPDIGETIRTHATWEGKRARQMILAGERELAQRGREPAAVA